MNALYLEVVGTVIVAGLVGLVAGWMAMRAQARRTLNGTIAAWQKRYDKLESGSGSDTDTLETQVQSLGQQVHAANDEKRALKDEVEQMRRRLDKAQDDSVKLNAQQAGTLERLQRKLRERDLRITQLTGTGTPERTPASPPASTGDAAARAGISSREEPVTAADEVESYIDRVPRRSERAEQRRQQALRPAASVIEDEFDQTALLDDVTGTVRMDSIDATEPATLAFEDAESTVALDDATLARARARVSKR